MESQVITKDTYKISRYLTMRFLQENVHKSAISLFNVKVIDVGCGEKPYRKYFTGSQLYVGVDKYSRKADIIAVAEALPVRNSCFDVVLCTQVLEHVENPKKALREIKYALRAGGLLILSTHGFWIEEHESEDYWRWTLQGLIKTLGEHGFKIVKRVSMEPIISLFQTVLLFIPQKIMFLPLMASMNIIAIALQKILRSRGPKLHVAHFIIAKNLKIEEENHARKG